MSKRPLIFIATALVCLALLVSISIPIRQVKEQIPFKLTDGTAGEITLYTPAYFRQGDWADVAMVLAFDQVESSDENIRVKASLQSVYMEVTPAGEVMAVIPTNGKGPFEWRVRSNSTGEQSANAWCFRQETAGQTLILAREMTFVVKSFFGVRFNVARWLLSGLTFLFIVLLVLSFRRNKNRIQSI